MLYYSFQAAAWPTLLCLSSISEKERPSLLPFVIHPVDDPCSSAIQKSIENPTDPLYCVTHQSSRKTAHPTPHTEEQLDPTTTTQENPLLPQWADPFPCPRTSSDSSSCFTKHHSQVRRVNIYIYISFFSKLYLYLLFFFFTGSPSVIYLFWSFFP